MCLGRQYVRSIETVAGGARDQIAVDAIIGHVDNSTAVHREHIEDDRLQAVVGHVHVWLYDTACDDTEADVREGGDTSGGDRPAMVLAFAWLDDGDRMHTGGLGSAA